MSTLGGGGKKQKGRSRIVVSVDDGRPQGRAGERTLKRRRPALSKRGRDRVALLIAVAGVALFVVLAVVRGWYQSYERSPCYSLALLVEAAGRGDRQELDALVDIDQVTSSLVPQVVSKVSGRAGAGGTAPVPANVRRYVETNAAVLLPGARDSVREALVQTVKSGTGRGADGYPFFVTALGTRWAVDDVREQGDIGAVSFKAEGQPVELTMQRAAGGQRWRVVAIKSDALATRIADNLARGLPALGR